MIEWRSFRDKRTGLPAYSLYGETRKPTPEMLDGVDVLVFDVQDVGTRVYTFIYTMALAMEAAREYGKRFIVLDRPNPIGGVQIEGNILEPEFRSFVGMFPIPMRHGMTIGELALLFNREFGIGCELEVVRMEGWQPSMWYEKTGLPWVMPSPNIPTVDTAVVYPGSVMVEGTMVSELAARRVRSRSLAPYIEPDELIEELRTIICRGRFSPGSFSTDVSQIRRRALRGSSTPRRRSPPFQACDHRCSHYQRDPSTLSGPLRMEAAALRICLRQAAF
jgi:uncharacterized protein YbbC (DUF1343 family)